MSTRRALLAAMGVLPLASTRAFADGRNEGNPPEISAWMTRAMPIADSADQMITDWEDRQHATGGANAYGGTANAIHCCGHQDARVIGVDIKDENFRKANEYEAKGGARYYVKINDIWHPIYDFQLVRNPLADPNPVGKTVVFYGYNSMMPGGVTIYCCSPWEADT
jgi:hypothetical protein